MRLTIFGTRGSNPTFGKQYEKYGGSTSCYLIESASQAIIVDAGTGIAGIEGLDQQNIPILMTHSHIDHMIGLMTFPLLKDPCRNITIYLAKRDGLSPRKQIERLISNPLWPCKITDYPAKVAIKELQGGMQPLEFGDIKVFSMEANHPGGSSIFRFEAQGKIIVLVTDHEHTKGEEFERLSEFSKGADILLYDAQYTEDEYHKYKGYGHSTPQAGIELARECEAKKIVFIHHSPAHDDEAIKRMEKDIRGKLKATEMMDMSFGYEGEVITL